MKRDNLKIGTPCHEAWDEMRGTTRKRFCDSCTKDVHDLSAMTQRSARKLVSTSDNLCVRYTVDANTGSVRFVPSRRIRWIAGVRRAAAAGVSLLLAAPALANGALETPDSDGSVIAELKERLNELLGTQTSDPDIATTGCQKKSTNIAEANGNQLVRESTEILMGDVAYDPGPGPAYIPGLQDPIPLERPPELEMLGEVMYVETTD
jgi:hypothetical protein